MSANHTAGSIARCFAFWQVLTSDVNILKLVKGCHLEFLHVPTQIREPNKILFNASESVFVNEEIERLSLKGVIKASTNQPGQYVSNVFLRPKKNGSFRLILNLKQLNKLITYHHFKMDTLTDCLSLMTLGFIGPD